MDIKKKSEYLEATFFETKFRFFLSCQPEFEDTFGALIFETSGFDVCIMLTMGLTFATGVYLYLLNI